MVERRNLRNEKHVEWKESEIPKTICHSLTVASSTCPSRVMPGRAAGTLAPTPSDNYAWVSESLFRGIIIRTLYVLQAAICPDFMLFFFSFLFFSHLDSHWILKTKLKQSLCIIKGMLMQQLLVSIRNKHFYFSICRCWCFLNTATPVGELLTTRLQEQASFAECVTRAAATWGGRNFKPSLHYSFPPVASEHGNGEHRDYECVDANSWSITLQWLSSWPQFVQGRCQEP